ncbi:MAG TPA: alpha/beta hydrolase [Candidatus Krumholzibacteria bacterium]|nr:alpha/beta hydrolase [Candidatus Krumholzibacteria bacterium]
MKNTHIVLLGGLLMTILTGCSVSSWHNLPTLEFDQVDYYRPVQTVQVRNITVGYVEQGQGPAMLLIHGLGSNAKGWDRNIDAWSRDHRVIAVDLPGYGYSSKGPYEYSMSFYATVLSELLDKLGEPDAVWVGHSMGGQIAMTAALERPEKVRKLVLFSPAGFERFDEGEGHWMTHALTPEFVRDTSTRGVAVNLHHNFHKMPPEAEFMIADRLQVRGASDFMDYCYAVSRNVSAMIDGPVWSRLGEIAQPTLILFGENDALIPNPYLHGGWTRDVAAIGEREIPRSELVMVPECGHFVQFERPEYVNERVAGFVR